MYTNAFYGKWSVCYTPSGEDVSSNFHPPLSAASNEGLSEFLAHTCMFVFIIEIQNKI